MRLLYKPFAIIAGVIAAKLGQRLFVSLWARIDDRPPPEARTQESSLPKVVGEDVAQAPGQAPATGTEQILRWKHWSERQSAQ